MGFYHGTRSDDDLVGTAGNDTFSFASVHLGPGDRVAGGAGVDNLQLGGIGPSPDWQIDAAELDGFSGIETYTLSFGIARFTLSDALIDRSGGDRVSVVAGAPAGPFTLTDASALTAGHRLAFFAYAPDHHVRGGAGDDTFQFVHGLGTGSLIQAGAGTDTLILADVTESGASLHGVSGIERLHLSGTDAAVALDDGFFTRNGTNGRVTVATHALDNVVDASAVSGSGAIDLSIYLGGVTAIGGAGADIFRNVYGNSGVATIDGGGGSAQDQLILNVAADYGDAIFNGITGVERIVLGGGGSRVVLTDTLVASAWDQRVVVVGGGDDVIDASAVTARGRVDMVAGSGTSILSGGFGDDSFHFTAAELTDADVVDGSIGFDRLVLNGPGGATLSGSVSSIEAITLNGGATAFLDDAFVQGSAGKLTVFAVGGTGTIDARALTFFGVDIDASASRSGMALLGGGGDDVLRGTRGSDLLDGGAGTNLLIGGAGADRFRFADRGEDATTISGFLRDDADTLLLRREAFAIDGTLDEAREDWSGRTFIGDADFVQSFVGGLDSGDAVMAYLRANGTGWSDNGMFVAVHDAIGAALYHVTDRSGQGGDAVLVTRFVDDGFLNPVDIDHMTLY
jgi:Ca2+-binding RTX toxin-like protein